MKGKILMFIFIAIFSHLAFGQEIVNHFAIEDKEIIWRKVYETPLTFEKLTEKLKDSGLFERVELGDNKLTGVIINIEADFNGAGFSEMGTPMYITRSHYSAFAIIEFKDGKYRVTLKKIILTQRYDDGVSKQGEKTNLDAFALKTAKDEMKGAFKKSPSLILNHTFTDKFSLRGSPSEKDW